MQPHTLTETEIAAGLDRVRQFLCEVINPVGLDTAKKLRFNKIHPLTGSKTLLLFEMRKVFDAGVAVVRQRAQRAKDLSE